MDTSLDQRRADRLRARWLVRMIAVAAMCPVEIAGAQMPGAPILQNVWSTPGAVGSINVGGGGGTTVYAGALSWTPAAGPSAGHWRSRGGEPATVADRAALMASASLRRWAERRVRLASPLFGGVGGGPARTTTTAVSCTVFSPGCAVITPTRATSAIFVFDSTTNTTVIPIGASIGWRMRDRRLARRVGLRDLPRLCIVRVERATRVSFVWGLASTAVYRHRSA